MTKREKIAITVCALIGFAGFCLAMIPAWFLLGYVFGEQTCFVYVEYDKLPYVMGEDYVYISPTFFEEQGFELYDNVSIMYSGKWGQYKDSNYETPIKKSRAYYFSIIEEGLEKYMNIEVSCDKTKYFDESSYEYTYGKYKYDYNKIAEYEHDEGENYYELEYTVFARSDSGNPCNFKVRIFALEALADDPQEDREGIGKYEKIFESMLDNLVGYSYFQ